MSATWSGVAVERGRPAEDKWIGQVLDHPRPDIAAIARAQGFAAETVTSAAAPAHALTAAEDRARQRQGTVIDARVPGY
jgi:hypothetical protein